MVYMEELVCILVCFSRIMISFSVNTSKDKVTCRLSIMSTISPQTRTREYPAGTRERKLIVIKTMHVRRSDASLAVGTASF